MSDSAAPSGRTVDRDDTTCDEFVEMEFTGLALSASDGATVRITDVQEPNSFGGWGYRIWSGYPTESDVGIVETLDEAKTAAESFMPGYQEAKR